MPQPVHRQQARHFLVGIATMIVLGLVAFIGIRANSAGEIPSQTYTFVKAQFHDVSTLKTRLDVRRNSVQIGQVTGIEYRDGLALVTLRLDGRQPVYQDATAKLFTESALGRQFVELDPGTAAAGPLGDGVIPTARTGDAITLDRLFDILDKPTRDGLASTVRELGRGLAGHGRDLNDAIRAAPDLLADLGVVSHAAASPQADLPGLLRSAHQLTGRFHARHQQIRDLLAEADSTLRAVTVDGAQPLNATLKGLPGTLRDARQTLEAVRPPLADVQSAVATLQPGGRALGESAADLRGVLREAVAPLDKVPDVADQAEPAVADLTHTVADARPLAPRLTTALDDADTLLSRLGPYAPDAGRFFDQLAAPDGLLSGNFGYGLHYFRATVAAPGPLSVASLPDPTRRVEPYPKPGETAWERPSEGGNR